MKQTRRILSIVLSLVLLLGTLSVGMSAFAAEKTTVRFGNYPQSEVTDIPLMGKLADVEKHWQSYNYYSGTGNMIGMFMGYEYSVYISSRKSEGIETFFSLFSADTDIHKKMRVIGTYINTIT